MCDLLTSFRISFLYTAKDNAKTLIDTKRNKNSNALSVADRVNHVGTADVSWILSTVKFCIFYYRIAVVKCISC